MQRILAVIVAAWACQGCFVFDELDKGMEIMEQHSPKRRDTAPAPTGSAQTSRAARGKEEPGLLTRLEKWWEERSRPKPPQRDPSDVIVRCQIAGAVHFTRKSDCRIRGGTAI